VAESTYVKMGVPWRDHGFESHTAIYYGRVAEWFMALVLKTSELERAPRVRISPLPQKLNVMKKEFDKL